MTRRIKKGSGIYAYLEASGILATGTDAEIAAMRKQYYKEYKKNWRKEKRSREREFTVAYDETELKIIGEAASKVHKTCARFIHEAALAYCTKHYLLDTVVLNDIRETLTRTCSTLESIAENSNMQDRVTNLLLQKIDALETAILSHLQYARSLEDWLMETVAVKPETKGVFLQLLKNL
jgi:hypothetical protein